jgi:hypothetical protein
LEILRRSISNVWKNGLSVQSGFDEFAAIGVEAFAVCGRTDGQLLVQIFAGAEVEFAGIVARGGGGGQGEAVFMIQINAFRLRSPTSRTGA